MNKQLFSGASLLSLVLGFALAPMGVSAGESDHDQHQQMNGEADPHAGHKAMMQEMDHSEHPQISGEADPHAAHKAMMKKPAKAAKSADVDLVDKTLVDQDGREVKFVSDVIGDRIVVMDFVYTTLHHRLPGALGPVRPGAGEAR